MQQHPNWHAADTGIAQAQRAFIEPGPLLQQSSSLGIHSGTMEQAGRGVNRLSTATPLSSPVWFQSRFAFREVMRILQGCDWPGNVRELRNVIGRAIVLSPGNVLHPTLPKLRQMTDPPSGLAHRTLAEAEHQHLLDVPKQTNCLIGGQEVKMRKLVIESRRLNQRKTRNNLTGVRV